jgi:hypothetical protein
MVWSPFWSPFLLSETMSHVALLTEDHHLRHNGTGFQVIGGFHHNEHPHEWPVFRLLLSYGRCDLSEPTFVPSNKSSHVLRASLARPRHWKMEANTFATGN